MNLPGQDAMARRAYEHVVPTRGMLPRRVVDGPSRQVGKRLLMALLVLATTVLIVWLDRAGYNDNADGEVDLLDAVYYATVTLSTTGYGDITPYSDGARLINVVLVTPLRVMFLIILV
nr:potassium channel family protein [Streptomyces sp. DSM 41633]